MSVLILYTSSFMSYKTASAATAAAAERAGAVYTGVLVGATAVTAAALHAQQWYEEQADNIKQMAQQSWEYLSTDGKAAFMASIDATAHGYSVAASVLSDWFTSLNAEYPVVVTGFNPAYKNSVSMQTGSGTNEGSVSFIPRSPYKLFYGGEIAGSVKININRKTYQVDASINLREGTYIEKKSLGIANAYVSYANLHAEVANNESNFAVAVRYLNMVGLTMPVHLVLNNEVLTDTLTLDGIDFANNWAQNLLNQSEANNTRPLYVDPAAVTTSAGTVYNPPDTTIKDIGGVPTAVTQTPTGDWVNTLTGDVVIPADVVEPVPTDPAIPSDNTGFWSGLWDWLKKILDAILSIPGAILSGLGALITSIFTTLFVPDTAFWQNNFNNLNGEFKRVLDPTAYTSILESFQNLTSPTFNDITIPSIMGSPTVVIVESDYINSSLSTIHDWIRGFFFVLLALYNINMIYKLVRGGDVMSAAARREARSGND